MQYKAGTYNEVDIVKTYADVDVLRDIGSKVSRVIAATYDNCKGEQDRSIDVEYRRTYR